MKNYDGIKFPKPDSDTISASDFRNINQTEASLQSQCDKYLQFYPDVWVIRIPDYLWSMVHSLIRDPELKRILGGIFGGMPDLVMFKKNDKYNSCLMIELKVKGRKLRQNQSKWAQKLSVHKVERFEDFEEIFTGWYNKKLKSILV